MECQCGVCVESRKRELERKLQKEFGVLLDALDDLVIEDELNRVLKGQLFTVTGRIDGILDKSFVGHVFSVKAIAGSNIVAQEMCDNCGNESTRTMTINTAQYGIMPVQKSYLTALMDW